ncbi:MAG: hypothetical protein QW814_00590 [Methanothrix sp.]
MPLNELFISLAKTVYIDGDSLLQQNSPKTSINGEEPWIKNPVLPSSQNKQGGNRELGVSLFGPLFLWALIIIIGIVLEVVVPALLGKHFASYAASYKTVGSYILGFPGVIILPLIISVWIGHKVGEKASGVMNAVKAGLVNGVYASIVYGVIIFVAQLMLRYTTNSYALTDSFLLEYVVAIPIAIVIVFTIIIAVLNELRH